MNIRLLRLKDIDIVSNIIVEGLENKGTEILSRVKEEINYLRKEDFNKYYVAELKNEVVGVLQVLDYDNVIHISVLSIRKKHQGKNIGSQLLKSIISHLTDDKEILVYSNDTAKEFYRNQGFQYLESAYLYEIRLKNINHDQPNNNITITTEIVDWMLELEKSTIGYSRLPLINLLLDSGGKLLSFGRSGFAVLHNSTIGPVIALNFDIALNLIKKSIELGGEYITILESQLSCYKNSTKTTLRKLDTGYKMWFGSDLEKNLDLEFAIQSFGFS